MMMAAKAINGASRLYTRKCVECERPFSLTGDQIGWFKSRGLERPRRCANCRRARREASHSQPAPSHAAPAVEWDEQELVR